jgi:hypothetical protein
MLSRKVSEKAHSHGRAFCRRPQLSGRLGLVLYERTNDRQFRRIVLLLPGLSGATLIGSALK